MNKVIYGLLSFFLVLGLSYLLLSRCDEPDKVTVSLIQLRCAQSLAIDPMTFKKDACIELNRSENCQFSESDREAVMEFFRKTVNYCTDKILRKQNLCTDKIERL
jgi:hypothetical protein